ncbi:hypothetical protein XENTR_v10011900 [Xenopus tropicalis]|nr:hypothetical protein XENTR_v10011900 [Xenopus tropicalis]
MMGDRMLHMQSDCTVEKPPVYLISGQPAQHYMVSASGCSTIKSQIYLKRLNKTQKGNLSKLFLPMKSVLVANTFVCKSTLS